LVEEIEKEWSKWPLSAVLANNLIFHVISIDEIFNRTGTSVIFKYVFEFTMSQTSAIFALSGKNKVNHQYITDVRSVLPIKSEGMKDYR
jgi:hypothetical protein